MAKSVKSEAMVLRLFYFICTQEYRKPHYTFQSHYISLLLISILRMHFAGALRVECDFLCRLALIRKCCWLFCGKYICIFPVNRYDQKRLKPNANDTKIGLFSGGDNARAT